MSRHAQGLAIFIALFAGCSSDASEDEEVAQTPSGSKEESGPPPSAAGSAGSAATPDPTPSKPDSGSSASPSSSSSQTPSRPSSPASNPPPSDSDPMMPASNNGGAMMDPKTPLDQIPDSCKGFEVRGLKESPGGSTLPNTCAPFHGTHNNPYAVRCIDADPSYKTPFSGDEYCILPPPADKGTQIHVGPKDYETTSEMQPFLLTPGSEVNTYFYINSQNTEARYFYRTNWRMRPGSHHMIITMMPADRGDGWAGMAEAGTDIGSNGRNFGGAQRTDVDRPQGTLDVPPENVGLGDQITPNQQFSFNLHHINTNEKDILREAWVNVWYKDEADVTDPMKSLQIMGSPLDVAVNPGERRELHYSCDVQNPTRIVTLIGHRHANTDRFGIWLERGSENIPVYESFDYTDMPTYQYDSISKNPVPSVENKIDGAHTGTLELMPGDKVHFVCDITNRQEERLRFANELLTGEMCIVFGSYTGGQVCGPARRVQD